MGIKILIHVEGGMIQDVFVDNPDNVPIESFVIRDFDTDGMEKTLAESESLYDIDGKNAHEYEPFTANWGSLKVKPFEKPVSPEDFD